jgi:hypothetical protein
MTGYALLLGLVLHPGGEIRPERTWGGVLPDVALRRVAPASRVITEERTFAAVWEAWRPGERRPPIDFTRSIVLVETMEGPNRMFIRLSDDGRGNVTTQSGGTLIGGPGFGYILAQVRREGIRTIDGRPLPPPGRAPGEPPRDEFPRPRPPGPQPPGPQPPGPQPPGPGGPTRDYVRVEVRGTLETGIMAIGGETTGTTIRARGMTFELQIDRPALRREAERLSGRTVVVHGELTMRRGVEIGQRWIIVVDRLSPVDDRREPGRLGGPVPVEPLPAPRERAVTLPR